jgi:hypothetical protein
LAGFETKASYRSYHLSSRRRKKKTPHVDAAPDEFYIYYQNPVIKVEFNKILLSDHWIPAFAGMTKFIYLTADIRLSGTTEDVQLSSHHFPDGFAAGAEVFAGVELGGIFRKDLADLGGEG